MTVLMTLKVAGDATKLEAEDRSMFETVVERAKTHGVISHHFYATDDEILVVDEWPDEESFRAFFEASPEVSKMMAAAGVMAQPEPTFWRKLDLGDDVG
jgi:heme-degrading monooxygenase HmoA